jgi:cytochrome c oxidase subunit II
VGAATDMSPLHPHSPASRDIATLWWWMLIVAGIVFLGAVTLLAIGWLRRGKPGLPFFGESERANVGLVIAFGMAIPIVVLVPLFIVSDLYVLGKTDAPEVSSTALTVTVVGHQWWWEARYPASGVVSANEIHIPARTPVNLIARTVDVIHSFWVPELNRKIDMIPGQSNRIELYAERPGTYRGQCAEFCGLQHAHMAFRVIAEPRPHFERWLATSRRPAAAPTGGEARLGEQTFMENACAGCHTIAGTPARGTVGPDLTHLASRETLAALTIPNNRRELGRWIRNPQGIKPGAKMPGLELSDSQFHAIVTYLAGLR